jgi:hypothetical protein
VDWTSWRPYQALAAALAAAASALPAPPYVFMNYRVYLRTAEECDRSFLRDMEAAAAAAAALVTVLSRADAEYVAQHLSRAGGPALRPQVTDTAQLAV